MVDALVQFLAVNTDEEVHIDQQFPFGLVEFRDLKWGIYKVRKTLEASMTVHTPLEKPTITWALTAPVYQAVLYHGYS